jgi:hypothetical protein
LAGLLFWPVRPEVLKPDRCRIRLRLLPCKRQLRSSGRIGITGAVYTRSTEDGRIISILDGEQSQNNLVLSFLFNGARDCCVTSTCSCCLALTFDVKGCPALKIAGASRHRGRMISGRQTGLSNIETRPDAIRGACGPSNDHGASSSGYAHAADSQRPHLLSPQQPLLDDRRSRRR